MLLLLLEGVVEVVEGFCDSLSGFCVVRCGSVPKLLYVPSLGSMRSTSSSD